MEQQALLQRRQRVDVFHTGQRIQLRLAQAGQWYVAGGQTGRGFLAVLGYSAQLVLQASEQTFQGRPCQLLRVEVQVQMQGAATLLGVDHQRCVQRRIGFAPQATFAQAQAAATLVKLAEVVEQQLRGAFAQLLTLAQQAVTETQIGHGAQLLLDRLEAGGQFGFGLQAHGVEAGEPADAARQVDIVEQRCATVALQMHGQRWLLAPAAQHSAEGSQQQFVGTQAISLLAGLQQIASKAGIQAQFQTLASTFATSIAAQQRQLATGALLGLPVQQLCVHVPAGQALAPGLEGAGLARQLYRQAAGQLQAGTLQIFQQHAPGHAIHH